MRGSGGRARLITGVLAVIAVIGVLVILVVVGRYEVPSESMRPTVNAGDHIWTVRTSGAHVGRGDIVLLRPPANANVPANITTVIARVVAVGGDTVEAAEGKLIVNGSPAEERYLPAGTKTPDIPTADVPSGTVYVLGDNRLNSQGSKVYGPVPNANVLQRVVLTSAPTTLVVLLLGGLLCLPFLTVLLFGRRSRPVGGACASATWTGGG